MYVDIQCYVPVLLENLCGMSCSGAYWLLDGGWFQCRYGGFWMVSLFNVPFSPDFSGVLRIWA